MNFLQIFGQLLRPAQETGVEKAQSTASNQQTPNEHYPELSMSNGNCLCGSDGTNFSRFTEHLVFAFLGGYMSMDDLPCLGDLANENNWCHGSTPIPMDLHSESSQVESLDLNGNLHQLSAISMDSDSNSRIMDDLRKSIKTSKCYQKPVENVSTLLDNFDASSTAYSPPEHTSQSSDEIELLPENSIIAHFICKKFVKDILNLDHATTNLLFQQCDLTGKFVLSTIFNGIPADSWDANSVPDFLFEKLALKLQKISVNRTTEIQEDALITHHHESNSGNFYSQFHRHHRSSNDVPVFNISSTAASKNRPINDENTFAIPKPETLMDYLYGDLEIPQFLNTEYFSMQSEDLCCTIGNNGEGPTFSVPDPSQLMNFLNGDLESPVFLSSESIEEEVPIYSEYDGINLKVEVISQSADDTIEESPQCSPIMSWIIQQTISGLMSESFCDSNGFKNGMDLKRVRISSSCQFEKESSEISDSKLSYHQDDLNVADCFDEFTSEVHNTSATEPNSPISKNTTTFVPTNIPLSYKSEDDEQNMKANSSPFTSNTAEPSLMNKNSTKNPHEIQEIYVSSLCCDHKACLLGYCGSDDDAEAADLSDCTLNDQCCDSITYNTLNLPIKSKNGSLAGAFEENEITPTSSALLECNREKIGSDSSFFDLSDHDDLLEYYGLSNHEQYTDTGYACESPTWPEKMTTVSRGQTPKSLTCLTSNLTEDDYAKGILTADPSLFHSDTDETSVMNKNWTDEIYEENLGNSVSLCHLNQMRCAFETSSLDDIAGSIDCVPLFDQCSDGFEDSIKHQSLENDKNELKFAFPDPSTLKDYFYGSLDSPQFLALELLDGKIDTLDYPSFYGGHELGHGSDEADLSDKMIFDQFCQDLSRDDNSINKFSCSIQLLDLFSSPFDTSDHDKLLERYRIDDQDQLIADDWTCDSPTWPGKM